MATCSFGLIGRVQFFGSDVSEGLCFRFEGDILISELNTCYQITDKSPRLHLYMKHGISQRNDTEIMWCCLCHNLKLFSVKTIVWRLQSSMTCYNAPIQWKYKMNTTAPIWPWDEYDRDSNNFSQRKWWVKNTWRLKWWQMVF